MRTKTIISALVFMPVNAVLFGAGIIPVLAIPELRAYAMILIPIVVAASLVASVPLSRWIAPRLRLRDRTRRPEAHRQGTDYPVSGSAR
ncbi:hypothetical protein [Polymorphum gilvum]|uniref:Uncharacterized protein n=1 Tax=Polymorphum gilvum (strain LMG 25793 / CGMCC 1.9160 / SL003B-26A1) TaxID=991905 RepID=F2J1I2_POLGS|nr:hypothetical protein [Polymorphum gilvum]ADZ69764.1 hypothetical protein SL003B_1336 [Polymorphum gilvum SL003B-26A1]